MFDDLRLFGVGMAAVIDTALVLTLVDRRNWRFLAVPIAMLALGAWLWHTGTFVYLLMWGATGGWAPAVAWAAAMAMVAGLLLMPSALLHGAIRFWRSGLAIMQHAYPRYALAYVPLVILVPAGVRLWQAPGVDFLITLAPLVLPFVAWAVVVNVVSAVMFFVLRSRLDEPDARRFFGNMAAMLVVVSVMLTAFGFASPGAGRGLMLLVTLSPLLPTLTFAFFVIRYNFMRLMIEQTIVYGAIVLGVLLFHRLLIGDVTDGLGRRFGFDVGVLEGLLIAALVLSYRPLRERTSEALRYLMGTRVADVRRQTREMAVELSRHAEDDPSELLRWFVGALARALNVTGVTVWLFDADDVLRAASADVPATDETAGQFFALLDCSESTVASRHASSDPAVLDLLKKCDAAMAVRMGAGGRRGLLLVGHRNTYAGMGEEELSATLLLAEQLEITLDNLQLRRKSLAAERRAMENEKLRTMGLVAGCLAHEVKNPLSSIKTITTVMAEQLGDASGHADDLRLVLGEVDRLAKTTGELLGFARPAEPERPCQCLSTTLQGAVQLMRHAARRQGVEIDLVAGANLPPLPADENAVREIVLNLLQNSLDAAGDGGEVRVQCHRNGRYVVTQFVDNGPGIAAAVQDRLFEPFATTKPAGTGLGLYIVAQRVQELGGDIRCETSAGGTTFVVRLPIETKDDLYG